MRVSKKPTNHGRNSFNARPAYANKRGPSAFGSRPFDKSVERFQATCNECHKMCEVPFRPNGKKPVYCRDCFKGKEDSPSHGVKGKYGNVPSTRDSDLARQFDLLNTKLDQLIKAVEVRSRS